MEKNEMKASEMATLKEDDLVSIEGNTRPWAVIHKTPMGVYIESPNREQVLFFAIHRGKSLTRWQAPAAAGRRVAADGR